MIMRLVAMLVCLVVGAFSYVAQAEVSAYQKWINSQYMVEYSDVYFSLVEVVEAVEEGIEEGKSGTERFEAACVLLFGEDKYRRMSEAEIETALKRVRKYVTGDTDGLQNAIDDLYERGILDKFGENYFFAIDFTLNKCAEKLEVSADLAEMMLLALNDYGWNVKPLLAMSGATTKTSAYERWIEARNTTGYSEKFYALKADVQTIQSRLRTGMVGRKDFKNACCLIFGEEKYKKMSVEEIDRAIKQVQKYFTGDVTGLQEVIDELYAQGILVERKSGEYGFVVNTTVDMCADALGVSVEVVKVMLLALTDYGWSIPFIR